MRCASLPVMELVTVTVMGLSAQAVRSAALLSK